MKSRLFSMLATISWMFVMGLTQAQVPRTINYQGYLTTPSGAPVNSPGLQMVFNIYNVAASGGALHTETQTVVVNNGIFNVLLGSAATLTLPFDVPYYLGVTPGADAEMTPRQPLAASPYAIRAATATTAASSDALSPAATVPGSQITNASITAAKLASSGCTGNQILQYNGSAWVCAALPTASGGTVTSVATGSGLTGGPITGSGTIAVDYAIVQGRVTDNCPPGSSIRAIATDGTVTCQANSATAAAPQATSTGVPIFQNFASRSATITIGSDGLPVIAFLAPTTSQLMLLRCGTPTCLPSGQNDVRSIDTASGQPPAIAIGSDGFPILSYHNGTTVKFAKCSSVDCATVTLRTIDSATASAAGNPSGISVGADGFPLIFYNRGTGLRVARCSNASCSTSTSTTLANLNQTTTHLSVATGSNGLPVVVFGETSSGFSSLRLLRCGDATCSAGLLNNVSVEDVQAANAFQYTSVAIGLDGLPIIAFYNAINGDLKVLRCTSAACDSNGTTTTTVDTTGDVGKYASIAIPPDGLPIISYYDATNTELKTAKCGNVGCTANNTIQSITADAGDVGQETSVTIGLDGMPVIAYTDVTNTRLRVARCNNSFCTPYFRRR